MKDKNKSKNKTDNELSIPPIAQSIIDTTPALDGEIYSDVFGSYTGTPLDGEEPVQDADDL